jgi:mannose-6-phosphate isomerase
MDSSGQSAPSSVAASSGLAPFRVEPRFVERVWGFKDLRPWFDRVAEGGPLGEVWLTGDECQVATGPHAGQTLGGLFAAMPLALLGEGAGLDGSPLLIKVLFAREKLSVQVHPDDSMAHKYGEPRGKTECWYALAAEPGAQVACGLKPGVTMGQIEDEIRVGTLEESLKALDVAPREMIYVDAGTVHAVWPGSILLETQQNCDLTYRMYDYGRGRELHIQKSLEATKLVTDAGKISPRVLKDRTILLDVKYFRIERIPVAGSISRANLEDEDKPELGLAYLFAAAGAGRLSGAELEAVDLPARGIVAVPASSPAFTLEDAGGLDLIRITPNWPEKI